MTLADREMEDFPLPIYIYDHPKNKLKSITIDGYGSRGSGLDSRENGMMESEETKICYYEDNIISLAFDV
ncbi:hypothetical protein LIER_34454 [Lithospermum erythrorhizon]|uniref:Uncharacterized protein n=1 Tax=Lithospermum erythrorhizon TaxID=34254 RepID=A0AAV3S468_LITER